MNSKKGIIICHVLMVFIFTLEAVKIGISRPLATTIAPNTTTTVDIITEESTLETTEGTTASTTAITLKTTQKTTATTTTTTTQASNTEAEWPEFPPPKKSNKVTTKKPTTTTTTIKPSITITGNTAELENELKPTVLKDIPSPHSTKNLYCFCDLQRDICDINCCCDPDCSTDALKVFQCLPEKPIDLEVHEGRFENFGFHHGLPNCEINDGWLCVFRTYKPMAEEEFTISYEDTSYYSKWPNLLLETEDIKNGDFYKYGDILRIINMETKEIRNFDLPSSFNSPLCRIREPVYHLKSIKRTCLIPSNTNLKKIYSELLHLQTNYKIFIKPTIPEDLYNNMELQRHIANITMNYCIENEKNCSKYLLDNNEIDSAELFKTKINIFHNFTHVNEMVLDLWFRNMVEFNIGDINTAEYWLEYEIVFIDNTFKELHNIQMNNKPKQISGVLGYLMGKPIIIGRYRPFNKTLPLSNKNLVINYFLKNNTDSHTLTLFGKVNGECTRQNAIKESINFGINTAKYCKIKLDNESLWWEEPLKTNFTKICLNLQEKIHDQLFGKDLLISELTSHMISQLGKPQNNSEKWLPLQVLNTNFNAVFGQYLQETNTFICRNILLSLTYEFQMASLTVNSIPWQRLIKHAALHLAERHDLEFALDENLEVPISMTVRFFDAHEKAVSAAAIFETYNLISFYILIDLVLVLNLDF